MNNNTQTAVYLLCGFLYNAFLHPLARYPGPVLYRGSRVPRLWHELRGDTVHAWWVLHEKYGDVVRIAPNQLSYISVAAWRDIYGAGRVGYSLMDVAPASQSSAKADRGQQMRKEELVFPGDDFEYFDARPMISCDATNHARHRRVVGHAFSDRALREYEPTLGQHADLFVQRLRERAADSAQQQGGSVADEEEAAGGATVVNMVDWFNFVMFDITSTLVFGESFGCLSRRPRGGGHGDYHPWVARVFPGMKLIAWSGVVAGIPGLGDVVRWLVPRSLVRQADAHMGEVVAMTKKRMAMAGDHGGDSVESPARPTDFMTHILPHVRQGLLSTDELCLNSQLLAIAGSETTATLLSGAVYYLSHADNATAMAKLVAEIRGAFGREDDMSAASSAGGLILARLPFLNAVINECLRLYPPGAINMPRTVPAHGAVISGAHVPGGAEVGIAQFAAYRSSRHFADPLAFRPERWLAAPAGSGRYANDNRDVFYPFSCGPRNCVGRNLAIVELRLVLARLLWAFDVEVLPDQEAWPVRQKTFLSWAKPPLIVRLTVAAR